MNKPFATLLLATLLPIGSAHAVPVTYHFRIDNPVYDWRVNPGERVDDEIVDFLARLAPAADIHGSFVYDSEAEGGPAITDFHGSAWRWNYGFDVAPIGGYRADEVGGTLPVFVGWSIEDSGYYFLTWASMNYLTLNGQPLDVLAGPASLEGATGEMDLFFNGSDYKFHPIRVDGLVITAVPAPPALLLFGSALLPLARRVRKSSR